MTTEFQIFFGIESRFIKAKHPNTNTNPIRPDVDSVTVIENTEQAIMIVFKYHLKFLSNSVVAIPMFKSSEEKFESPIPTPKIPFLKNALEYSFSS